MPNPTLLILLFYTQREIITNQRLLAFTLHTQILSTCYEHTKNRAMLILAAGWFDLDVESLSVIIRRVRLVSLRSSEAEFCPGDAAVHVFDVLTLRLKMICGVVGARNKYLANTNNWQSLYISFWLLSTKIFQGKMFCFPFGFFYLILYSIVVWNEQVADRNKSE